MAIIASIEVNDEGTAKIQGFTQATRELDTQLQRTAATSRTTAGQHKEHQDALSRLQTETLAVRETQAKAATEVLRTSAAFQSLTGTLKAGMNPTAGQVLAIQELSRHMQRIPEISNATKAGLAGVAQNLKVNTTLTAQQAKALQAATQEYNNLNKATLMAQQGQLGFQSAALAVAAATGVLTAGLYSMLDAAAKLAARSEVLSLVQSIVASNSRYAGIAMAEQSEAVRRLGITTIEAKDTVLQFAAANLDLANAAKIARAAQDFAVVAGLNSSQATKTLTAAIMMQQPILLRQFGIVTGLNEIYAKYQAEMGKTRKEMDAFDKRQAFINKIMEESVGVAGAYEASMTKVGKQLTSLNRYYEEASLALGKALLPALEMIVQVQTKMLEGWLALDPAIQAFTASVLAGVAAVASLLALIAGAKFLAGIGFVAKLAAGFKDLIGFIGAGFGVWESLVAVVGGPFVAALVAAAAAVGVLVSGLLLWRYATRDMTEEATKQVAAANATISSLEDTYESLRKLADITLKTDAQQKQFIIAQQTLQKLLPMVDVALLVQQNRWEELAAAIDKATAAEKRKAASGVETLLQEQSKLRATIREKEEQLKRIQAGTEVRTETVQIRGGGSYTRQVGLTAEEAKEAAKTLNRELENLRMTLKNVGATIEETLLPGESAWKKFETQVRATSQTIEAALGGSVIKAKEHLEVLAKAGKQGTAEYEEALKAVSAARDREMATMIRYNNELADNYTKLKVAEQELAMGRRRFTEEEINIRLENINALKTALAEGIATAQKAQQAQQESNRKHLQNTRETLQGISNAQMLAVEDMRAMEEELSKAKGWEEYDRIVENGAGILKKFGEQVDVLKDKFPHLYKEFMLATGGAKAYAESIVELRDETVKMLIEIERKYAESAESATLALLPKLAEMQKQLVDETRAGEQQILDLRTEMYEKTVVTQMGAYRKMLYEEQKYWNGYRKGIQDRIRAMQEQTAAELREMDLRLEAEKRANAKVIEGYKQKLNAAVTVESAMTRVAQINAQMRTETDSKTLTALMTERQQEIKLAEKLLDDQLAAANKFSENMMEVERARHSEIVAGRKQTAAELEKIWSASFAAEATQTREMVKLHQWAADKVRTFWTGAVEQMVSGFAKGFVQMLTGAKTMKDELIGIWEELKRTFFKIVDDMLQKWISYAFEVANTGKMENPATGMMEDVGGNYIQRLFKGFSAQAAKNAGNWLTGAGAGAGPMTMGGGATYGNVASGVTWTQQAGQYGLLGSTAIGGYMGLGGGTALASTPIAGYMTMPGAAGMGGVTGSVGGVGGSAGGAGGFSGLMGPVGGSFGGAAAGGFAGYMVGKSTGSYGGGALAGAGTGAGVGFALGGPIGAGVGAAVGAIAGWWGAKKAREETEKAREAFIKASGGLEELKKQAELAGMSLDKLMDAKNLKAFNAEMEKIANGIAVRKLITNFEQVAGGADALKIKAQQLGISLDEMYKAGVGAEELAKSLQLIGAKLDLAKTKAALWDLRKQAQLVGYDLQRIFDTKNIDEFNQEQAVLNALLEKQQIRLQGLATAAAGLEQMVLGLEQRIARTIKELADSFSKEFRDKLAGAYKLAVERGYKGTELKFLIDIKGELNEKDLAKLNQMIKDAQAEFNTLGSVAAATFAGVLRETGDLVQALNSIEPSMVKLAQLQEDLGLKAEGAFAKLLEFRKIVKDNEDIANSLSGIASVLRGLGDAGILTQDMFSEMGASVADMYQKLVERGTGEQNAMLMSRASLQQLWQMQKDYGYTLDENTQKLVDQAVEQGLVGDKFKDTNQKILDMLIAIGTALGAVIPEYLKVGDVAEDTGKRGEDAGRRHRAEIERARKELQIYGEYWGEMDMQVARDELGKVEDAQGGVENGQGDIQDSLEESMAKYRKWRDVAVDACNDVYEAEQAVASGRSPGGVAGITTELQNNMEAFRDWSAVAVQNAAIVEQSLTGVFESPQYGEALINNVRQAGAAVAAEEVTIPVTAAVDATDALATVSRIQNAFAGMPPAAIPVTADASSALETVARVQTAVATPVAMPVTADTSGATAALAQAQVAAPPEVVLTATMDVSDVLEAAARLREAAEDVPATVVPLTADASAALGAVEQVQVALADLAQPAPVQVAADVSAVLAARDQAQAALESVAPPPVALTVDTSGVRTAVDQIQTMAASPVPVTLDVEAALSAAEQVRASVPDTVPVTVPVTADLTGIAGVASQIRGAVPLELPVTMPISAETDEALGAVAQARAAMGQDLVVPLSVEADTAGAMAALSQIREVAPDQVSVPVAVTADVEAALAGLEQVRAALPKTVPVEVALTADPSAAVAAVEQARLTMEEVSLTPLPLTADATGALATVADLQAAVGRAALPALSVEADTTAVTEAMAQVREATERPIPVTADATEALGVLESVQAALPASLSATVSVAADVTAATEAMAQVAVPDLPPLTLEMVSDTAAAEEALARVRQAAQEGVVVPVAAEADTTAALEAIAQLRDAAPGAVTVPVEVAMAGDVQAQVRAAVPEGVSVEALVTTDASAALEEVDRLRAALSEPVPATMAVSVDATGALAAVRQVADALPSTTTVEVAADVTAATEAIAQVRESVPGEITVPVTATLESSGVLDAVSRLRDVVGDTPAMVVPLAVDATAAAETVDRMQTALSDLSQSGAVSISADVSSVMEARDQVQAALEAAPDPLVLAADPSEALEALRQIQNTAAAPVPVSLDVTSALETMVQVRESLPAEIPVTVPVTADLTGLADVAGQLREAVPMELPVTVPVSADTAAAQEAVAAARAAMAQGLVVPLAVEVETAGATAALNQIRETVPDRLTVPLEVTPETAAALERLDQVTAMVPEAITVPVTLAVDPSEGLAAVEQARLTMAEAPDPIPLTVEVASALESVRTLQGTLAQIVPPAVPVTADVSGALEQVGRLTDTLAEPVSTTVHVVAETAGVRESVEQVVDTIPSTASISVAADLTAVTAAVAQAQQAMPSEVSVPVTATADTAEALEAIRQMQAAMAGLPGAEVEVTADTTAALDAVAQVREALAQVPPVDLPTGGLEQSAAAVEEAAARIRQAREQTAAAEAVVVPVTAETDMGAVTEATSQLREAVGAASEGAGDAVRRMMAEALEAVKSGAAQAATAVGTMTDEAAADLARQQEEWRRAGYEVVTYADLVQNVDFSGVRRYLLDIVDTQGEVETAQAGVVDSLGDSMDRWREWRDVAVAACEEVYEAEGAVEHGRSPGGLTGITEQTKIAIQAFHDFAASAGEDLSKIEGALESLADIERAVAEESLEGAQRTLYQLGYQQADAIEKWLKESEGLSQELIARGLKGIEDLYRIKTVKARNQLADEQAREAQAATKSMTAGGQWLDPLYSDWLAGREAGYPGSLSQFLSERRQYEVALTGQQGAYHDPKQSGVPGTFTYEDTIPIVIQVDGEVLTRVMLKRTGRVLNQYGA